MVWTAFKFLFISKLYLWSKIWQINVKYCFFKNPEATNPSYAGLPDNEKVTYPTHLTENFGGRRFISLTSTEFIDYEGAELLFIGAKKDIAEELGEAGKELDPVEDTTNERDYRSIEGKAKVMGDTDLVSSSEDEETFSYSEELRQRTVELDKKLQSHPHEIQSWLDYVSLQDDLVPGGQKASVAEIKMGILQKALQKNPGNTTLLVELIKIESILWEYPPLLNLC